MLGFHWQDGAMRKLETELVVSFNEQRSGLERYLWSLSTFLLHEGCVLLVDLLSLGWLFDSPLSASAVLPNLAITAFLMLLTWP